MTKYALRKITIAIDGYSSCGKSTLAKAMARELGYIYVDSGAMYRAITLNFIRQHVDISNQEEVNNALQDIHIHFQKDKEGNNHMILNEEDVEAEIRQMQVSSMVSQVAAIPQVRRVLVEQQRKMGQQKGIVMDGRDIGTVVFPDAELKIFLTASPEIRAIRRYQELLNKNQDTSLMEVRTNLAMRDRIDSTREDSPLRQANDAIVIDNTYLNEAEQLQKALDYALTLIET
ncbi:MAG: cytidylate kinase [Saprospiraceae bacterium]|nr:MAG: cytidylate kinase [Saprospiraceae bacterium]